MCISYCHRFQRLYWNHDSCAEMCPLAGEPPGSCQSCQHRQGGQCGLTYAPLPEAGGCCHWNVATGEDWVPVTPGMLAPLAGLYETVGTILADVPHEIISAAEWAVPAGYIQRLEQWGIEYRAGEHGILHLDPKQLVLVVTEPVTDILVQFEVPYQASGGWIVVDLAELTVPTVYGEPTEE